MAKSVPKTTLDTFCYHQSFGKNKYKANTPAISAVIETVHRAAAVSVFAVPLHLPHLCCGARGYVKGHAACGQGTVSTD
jgi:hypothetical protein